MKLVRILAIVPLALVSLFNVGYAFGTEPKPDLALAIAVLVLGLAGFVASFGLARHSSWGIPAALTVAGINVVGAIIALVSDGEGAVIGLGLSALALVLVFIAGAERRATSPVGSTS
ncbi:MAG: hypothetical protein ACRDOT_05695 [Aeromicrobium sp.]